MTQPLTARQLIEFRELADDYANSESDPQGFPLDADVAPALLALLGEVERLKAALGALDREAGS